MNSKRKIYKCSNPDCGFEDFLSVETITSHKGACLVCGEGKLVMDRFDQDFDPAQYPTLAKYPPRMAWEAVIELQGKYPGMTEEQCLLNLDMDLEEKELLAKG